MRRNPYDVNTDDIRRWARWLEDIAEASERGTTVGYSDLSPVDALHRVAQDMHDRVALLRPRDH